jgi:hypothetical protein
MMCADHHLVLAVLAALAVLCDLVLESSPAANAMQTSAIGDPIQPRPPISGQPHSR